MVIIMELIVTLYLSTISKIPDIWLLKKDYYYEVNYNIIIDMVKRTPSIILLYNVSIIKELIIILLLVEMGFDD